MNWSKEIDRELNSNRITFSNILEEVIEVWESKTPVEALEEMSDVLYFIFSWIYQKTGLNLPMVGCKTSIDKYRERIVVWEEIFEKEGLKFSRNYLVGGSNHEKEEKIRMALDLARKDQRK